MATLAINGGEPIRTDSYPTWPTQDPADIEAFENIYKSGQWVLVTKGSRICTTIR